MAKKILLVDDDPRMRALMRATLGDDFELDEAGDGKEALTHVQSDPPDLILLDVIMPGMDGLETCALLKRDPKTNSIPVVILTGQGSQLDVRQGKEAGADDYFIKPFSPTALLDKVYEVLGQTA